MKTGEGTGTGAGAAGAGAAAVDSTREEARELMEEEMGQVAAGGEGDEGQAAADGEGGEGEQGGEGDEGQAAADGEGDEGEQGKETEIKGLTPELQEKIDRRIGKEVAKREALREEIEAAEARYRDALDEARELRSRLAQGPVRENGSGPMPTTVEEVDEREEFLWKVKEFCEEHAEGYEGNGQGDPSYTPDQIRKRRLAVERELARDIPKARERIAHQADYDREVVKVYPKLTDRYSPELREAERLAREIPGLKLLPDWKIVAGDLLAGRKLRLNGKTGAQAPAVRPKAPAAPGRPIAGRAGIAERKTKTKNVDETFAGGGFTDDALAKALE